MTATSVSAPDGTISSMLNGAANQIGKLQVVDFANERAADQAGRQPLFHHPDANTVRRIRPSRQGMLEGSNVEPVIEISHMIEVMRAYEATATLTQFPGRSDAPGDRQAWPACRIKEI